MVAVIGIGSHSSPAARGDTTDDPTPPLPVCENNVPTMYDQLTGQLSVINTTTTGTLGNYQTRTVVRGTVNGTNKQHIYGYMQIRVTGCNQSIAASRVIPQANPPGAPITPVVANAQINLQSGGCSSEALVELWVTSENSTSSVWAHKLAELKVRTPDPHGSLRADPPICIETTEEMPCGVTLTYETSGLAGVFNRVFIVSEDCAVPPQALPFGRVLAEVAPNTSGKIDTAMATGCLMSETGTEMRMYALNSFQSPLPYAQIVNSGTLLGSAVARSASPNAIVCPVDKQFMLARGADPTAYIGVVSNNSRAFPNAIPSVEEAAMRMSEAGVRVIHHAVHWDFVQPSITSQYNWTEYDELFRIFNDEGIEPWIILTGTPDWAGMPVAPGIPCTGELNRRPIAPQYMKSWRTFVAAAAERYGPGGEAGLSIPCTNWEIWNEPEFFYCAPVQDWGAVYTAGREEIKAVNPSAMLWAPNTVFILHDVSPDSIRARLDYAVNNLQFDGFAIHLFMPDTDEGREQLYNGVRYVRKRLDDAFGVGVKPLLATEVSNDGGADPWGFARLTDARRYAFLRDCYACASNAGAIGTIWFNMVDRSGCCASPNFPLFPQCDGQIVAGHGLGLLTPRAGQPPYHMTNPHYDALQDVTNWLSYP